MGTLDELAAEGAEFGVAGIFRHHRRLHRRRRLLGRVENAEDKGEQGEKAGGEETRRSLHI